MNDLSSPPPVLEKEIINCSNGRDLKLSFNGQRAHRALNATIDVPRLMAEKENKLKFPLSPIELLGLWRDGRMLTVKPREQIALFGENPCDLILHDDTSFQIL